MKTTLNKIRANHPCGIRPGQDGTLYGFRKLMASLGKEETDNEPVTILQILDSNGLDDALWCLETVEGYEKEMRLFAVWCARQVQYLMKNEFSINALDTAVQFANGEITENEREQAYASIYEVATSGAASAARNTLVRSAAQAAIFAASYASDAVAWEADRACVEGSMKRDARSTAREEMKAKQEQQLRKVLNEIG